MSTTLTDSPIQHAAAAGPQLHVPGYFQDEDPGAVGAGMSWTTSTGIHRVRNASNSGWLENLPEFDLRAYGAVSGQECTSAFQAAVTAVANVGGGRILVPAGRWKISLEQIVLCDLLTMQGFGASSIIDYSDFPEASGDSFFVMQLLAGLGFEWLTFYANGLARNPNGTGQNVRALRFEGCSDSHAIGCRFITSNLHSNTGCVKVACNGQPIVSRNIRLLGNYFNTVGDAVLASNAVNNVETVGASIEQLDLSHNIIYQPNNSGAFGALKIDVGVDGATLHANEIDGCGLLNDGVNIQDGASNVEVTGGVIRNVARNAVFVQLDDNPNNVLDGVTISDLLIDTARRAVRFSTSGPGVGGWRNAKVKSVTARRITEFGIGEASAGINGLDISGCTVDECGGTCYEVHGPNFKFLGNTAISSSPVVSLSIGASASGRVSENHLLAADGNGVVVSNAAGAVAVSFGKNIGFDPTGAFDLSSTYSGQDYLRLLDPKGTPGNGNYGAGIGAGILGSGQGSTSRRVAIAPVQIGTDQDQMGWAFLFHPSGTGSDPMEVGALLGTKGFSHQPQWSTVQVTVSGDVDSWNPGRYGLIVVTSAPADFNVTGIANGDPGAWRLIMNRSGHTMTLKNASTASPGADRFAMIGAADVVVPTGHFALVVWGPALSRWFDVLSR